MVWCARCFSKHVRAAVVIFLCLCSFCLLLFVWGLPWFDFVYVSVSEEQRYCKRLLYERRFCGLICVCLRLVAFTCDACLPLCRLAAQSTDLHAPVWRRFCRSSVHPTPHALSFVLPRAPKLKKGGRGGLNKIHAISL